MTTPNVEYNVRYEGLPPARCGTATTGSSGPGREFAAWADAVVRDARLHGPSCAAVGDDDPEVGPPTQMAVFTRRREAAA